MEKRAEIMAAAAAIARKWEHILDIMVITVFSIVMAYAWYVVADSQRVITNAGGANIATFRPKEDSGEGDEASYEELLAMNPDVKGWVYIQGTGLDFPILQSTDNVRYLDHDAFGGFQASGSAFLDYRNAPDFSDGYSLVYGHHMQGGQMFGAIDAFKDETFLMNHNYGTLHVGTEKHALLVLCCLEVGVKDMAVFLPGKADGIRKKVAEAIGKDPGEGLGIIAFSTCGEDMMTERTALICKIY